MWELDYSYLTLPEIFYQQVHPTPVAKPSLVMWNDALAEDLGLVVPEPTVLTSWLSGNDLPPQATPFAQAYAGHQFGHFTMLGDGRAIVLGEVVRPDSQRPNVQRVDLQYKGSGPTAYSRRGDGRAALGPMLREYLISEAMAALGIPTTRSLAVVATGEPVYREAPLPGAILMRVASSHLRVGTFEFAARQSDPQALAALFDFSIQRHDPECARHENPALAFLQAVCERQVSLITHWMRVGFVHGVMNTDNMTISGETIDYGPCAFMNAYHPETVFSSIDHQGRYAYGNQPRILQWNLARLAESLLPLLDPDPQQAVTMAQETISAVADHYQTAWQAMMAQKLGLEKFEATDNELIADLLSWMIDRQADYTNTFRALSSAQMPTANWAQDQAFQAWCKRWQERLAQQDKPVEQVSQRMKAQNPAVIPRNHQVEAALTEATETGSLATFKQWLDLLKTPYADLSPEHPLIQPPPEGDRGYKTFCGT